MQQLTLPIDLPGIAAVIPTTSMVNGTSRLVQCGDCGVAMAVPDGCLSHHRHDDPLGPCPRCGHPTWWNGRGDQLGPFQRTPEATQLAGQQHR